MIHPSIPVGDYRGNLCLLQHDFGYPDGIRISCLAPGKRAGILAIPRKQGADNRFVRGEICLLRFAHLPFELDEAQSQDEL